MKKFWIYVLTALAMLFAFSLAVRAEYQFDASYYARKYPDVVQALGNDPGVLADHFRMYGYKEGRFANQQEEMDSMLPGYSRPDALVHDSPEPAQPSQVTEVDRPATVTSTPSITILPGMSTYVDVSIADQVVTYFENGEAKFQSPCVTGSVAGHHDTPAGTYSIMTKVQGKYLVGPTWKCWVDRWMQFTPDHIGFHDASWRSSFGGSIYQTDGSHGCVNLPKEAAYSLYDMVSVGTAVVVH